MLRTTGVRASRGTTLGDRDAAFAPPGSETRASIRRGAERDSHWFSCRVQVKQPVLIPIRLFGV